MAALQISHILMAKLPSTYRVYFEREGVLFEISKLAYLGAELSLTKDQSKTERPEPKVVTPPTATPASTTSASTSTSTNSDANTTEEQPVSDAKDTQVDDDPFSETNMGQRLLGLVTELRNMRERRGQQSVDDQLNAIEGELAKAFTKIASTSGEEPSSEGESSSTRQHLRILQRMVGGGSRSVVTAHKEERGLGSGKTKDWIFERASIIVELCEDQKDSTASCDATSALAGLQRIAAGFRGSSEVASASLKELASYFSEKGTTSISSFEFLNSGLPQSLLDYLTAPPVLSNSTTQAQRYQAFVETYMVASRGAKSSPFSLLVKKMQEALTRMESFEVEAAQNTRGDVQGNPSSSLATQLRLKISPEEGTEVPSTYQNLNVSIHAIATFRTLDEYLRPRLKPKLTTLEKVTTFNIKDDQKFPDNESKAKAETATRKSSRLQKVAAPPTPSDDTEKTPEAKEEVEAKVGVEAHDDEEHDEEDNNDEEHDHEDIEDMEYERDLKLAGSLPVDVDSDIKMTEASTGDAGAKNSKSSKTASSKSDDKASSSPWHIQFSLHGVPIDTDMTVYGAIHEYERKHGKSAAQRSGWPTTYPITYRRVDTVAPEQAPLSSQSQRSSIEDNTFTADVPKELAQQSDLSPLLCLLRVLHGLNDDWSRFYGSEAQPQTVHHLEPKEFVNSKITAKVNRQLEEPLIVASACLPQWTVGLVTGFPFLFPFETRYTYLQSTSFGFSRSIMRWQNQQQRNGQTDHRDDSHTFLGRIQRQKVRISRHKALESAVRVMELYGSSQTMLEVEYYEEVGTGLGPTLEFYSVVSREFCKKSLKLWRDSDPESKTEYVTTPHGLFPRPLAHLKGHANES